MDLICPICSTEFEGKIWYSGECPNCGIEYYWDEGYSEEFDDCWVSVDWDIVNFREKPLTDPKNEVQ